MEGYAEFQTAALLAFTRLKVFWFEMNSLIVLQFAGDHPDNIFLLRAGLVAALIETTEPPLPRRPNAKVDSFLSAVVAGGVDKEGELGWGSSPLPGTSKVLQEIMNLLSNIESLSERVMYQEGELIQLRSRYESS